MLNSVMMMVGLVLASHVVLAADASPEEIVLWPQGAPEAKGTTDKDIPVIQRYAPSSDNATGAAIVVCPGGGYGGLAMDHEGDQIGRWLNSEGISAFVLRYRHAPGYKHPVPLMDAQRALRTVRARAGEWGVNPGHIGILGFSAGGHLTGTAGTHFDAGNPKADDPIDRASCRPDFLVLVYPVITLEGPFAHMGSRKNLLGEHPAPELVKDLSLENAVTKDTPPTFLFHTSGDTGVPSENSILFYRALHDAKVPAEMHIFEKGEHGAGLAPKDPALSVWPKLCITWLRGLGML
ncbi:MAG TPA: alpha/beta hydrolase [Candidatus Hydrogenedentes bacterium]|nr:alpha/beta hydrolase [Candidatus Hydrogenedentota bacterium]